MLKLITAHDLKSIHLFQVFDRGTALLLAISLTQFQNRKPTFNINLLTPPLWTPLLEILKSLFHGITGQSCSI
ncbi:hypothetical protein BV98_003827 [Sphingobium herbicidovorans NBRC 16415]|uniref:Uncharacterized protein n=1 Tax=Sphingobium herbicidovorans (strain ATCC 700291 / DSM 11019 / CCUG 56400 / KCTC 2939 / LMG 18315 / NBRC 16415 / MH) TaxID=1219045 RepID=A0A086P4V9_SPHHM|nr:hypothetical protein BV98_003827 [Sphingobium herbicidovorans NBRC 16415]